MDRSRSRALGRAAEGLGYGRDRAALRELGLGLVSGMPPDEALWRAERLGRNERVRVRGLLALVERWRADGPVLALRRALAVPDARAQQRALLGALRVEGGVVSPGRALILAANVALPFAVAAARAEGDAATQARAQEVFARLPGLPSNAITRTMREQLALPRLPGRARAHQGLHYLWAAHCREQRCAACPCARSASSPT